MDVRVTHFFEKKTNWLNLGLNDKANKYEFQKKFSRIIFKFSEIRFAFECAPAGRLHTLDEWF